MADVHPLERSTMRAILLEDIEKIIAAGPFHGDWDSLSRFRVPAWYQEGKFGIFIHWGSIPCRLLAMSGIREIGYLSGNLPREDAWHSITFSKESSE